MNEENLDHIKRELDDASERLNKAIYDFEDYLKKLHLGVEAFVQITDTTAIGYTKIDGKWTFCISLNNKRERQSAISAPRGLRLQAYKHREKLIPALFDTAKSLTKRINQTLEGIKETDANTSDS